MNGKKTIINFSFTRAKKRSKTSLQLLKLSSFLNIQFFQIGFCLYTFDFQLFPVLLSFISQIYHKIDARPISKPQYKAIGKGIHKFFDKENPPSTTVAGIQGHYHYEVW